MNHTGKFYTITYAFTDDPENIYEGIVYSFNCSPEEEESEIDDHIFFYGLDEEDIKKAISSKEPVNMEFYILDYYKHESSPF